MKEQMIRNTLALKWGTEATQLQWPSPYFWFTIIMMTYYNQNIDIMIVYISDWQEECVQEQRSVSESDRAEERNIYDKHD